MSSPERFIAAVLADPEHKLPMPNVARLFSAEGEQIDTWDQFWLALLADGSIKPQIIATPAETPAEPVETADHTA